MDKSIEKNIQRIRLFSLTCTLNDNGTIRHFYNGHEYVEIGGIKWATCNVGATKPTDSGLYFQWGETQGYTAEQVRNGRKQFNWKNHKYTICNNYSKYNDSDKKTTLESSDDAATFNMGIGWRMPTREEFKSLVDSTTSEWVKNHKGSGVNGRLFTDKKDKTKQLFFPTVGFCDNGSVYGVGSLGLCWSSSLYASNLEYGFGLCFNDRDVYWDNIYGRCFGFAVRGVVG